MDFSGAKMQLKFDGSCLKQEIILYEINLLLYDQDTYFTLENSLCGAVKLTEYSEPNKYSRYVIGFDAYGSFSLSTGDGFCKNVIIFGVDYSSSAQTVNRKEDILILAKCPTDGLNDTVITAEAKYSINVSEPEKFLFKSTLQGKQ